jgi:hypothetical protein
MIDLATELSRLLPDAVAWVQAREAEILATGYSLSAVGMQLAVSVGVRAADLVRIKVVQRLPQPEHPELRAIADQTGLLGPDKGGVTFGRGIYIVEGNLHTGLLSHELRHVHQYEVAGSIADFLEIYLQQVATVGYDNAPLELDAKAHERDAP